MTKKELVEQTRKALAEFDALPPEEWLRCMVAWGLINERGEVLANSEDGQEEKEPSSQNGTFHP